MTTFPTSKAMIAKTGTVQSRTGFAALLAVITVGTALTFGLTQARAAENVTTDQIVRALAGPKKPVTRGLSVVPLTPEPTINQEQAKFLQSVRDRPTRSLSTTEREEIATIAQTRPKIDLEITFDYNSANISSKSMASVDALGRALTSPDLKGATFMVAGHTDAAGGESYNQDLSERRADSIKRYLIDKYGMASADLVTVGYGKTKLKDPNQPLAEVNRRVQVVNMQNKATAEK